MHSKRVLKDFGLSESKINATVTKDLYIAQIVAPVRQQSNCADGLYITMAELKSVEVLEIATPLIFLPQNHQNPLELII